MNNIYRGSFVSFNTEIDYDYIRIANKNIYNRPPYYIPLNFKTLKTYDNYKEFEFENESQLVVNYIKRVPCNDTIGLLKFREFEDIKATKEEVVFYEVFNLQNPFKFCEFYDGISFLIKFTEVKIDYKIISNGFVSKIGDVYKITNSKEILITGENFYFAHIFKFKSKYEFHISKIANNIQVKIFPISLIEKYKKLDDTKKDELVDFYEDLLTQSTDKLEFYESTDNLIPIYTQEKFYLVDSVVIFNPVLDENFKTIVDKSHKLEQTKNVIYYNDMTLILLTEFV